MFDWVIYIDLQKYWNFQSEAQLEQIIAIVITHSVFLFVIQIKQIVSIWEKNWLEMRYGPVLLSKSI